MKPNKELKEKLIKEQEIKLGRKKSERDLLVGKHNAGLTQIDKEVEALELTKEALNKLK